MMVADGSWHRNFIPTVLLWAGSRPDFWFIDSVELLNALQAIFDAMYPSVKHTIQPKGPIMGVVSHTRVAQLNLCFTQKSKVNQRLCTWCSNFGSTSIALLANFFISSRVLDLNEDDEDDSQDDKDSQPENAAIATSLLDKYAFLYENPDTRIHNEIYRSAFMLEIFATAHLSSLTGFIDVPKLNTHSLLSNSMESVIAACAASVSLISEPEHRLLMVGFYSLNVLLTSSHMGRSMWMSKTVPGVAVRLARRPSSSTKLLERKVTPPRHSRSLTGARGTATHDYYLSIKKRGPQYTADIIIMARQFLKDQNLQATIKNDVTVTLEGERALLCKCHFIVACSAYMFQ